MVTVTVENDNLEKALRKFRKEIDKEDIIREYKDRRYFEKPSLKEHKKKRTLEHKLKKEEEAKNKELDYFLNKNNKNQNR